MTRQILSLSLCYILLFLTACAKSESGDRRPGPQDPAPLPPKVIDDAGDDGETVSPEGAEQGDADAEPGETGPLAFLQAVGSAEKLELATWNLENFPKDELSLSYAKQIIARLDVDVIALQEIASVEAVQGMLESLPGYELVLSSHAYGNGSYQKVGFLYNSKSLELISSQLLFVDDPYAFPRPPLEARFRYRGDLNQDEQVLEFAAIVVHLKASRDDSSRDRRIEAHQILESYVSDQIALTDRALPHAVLGDFNETINGAIGAKVHKPWFDEDEIYQFPTLSAADNGEYSFISASKSLIDHIILSQSLSVERVEIPKIHLKLRDYRDQVSDHLPVISLISGF